MVHLITSCGGKLQPLTVSCGEALRWGGLVVAVELNGFVEL